MPLLRSRETAPNQVFRRANSAKPTIDQLQVDERCANLLFWRLGGIEKFRADDAAHGGSLNSFEFFFQ
jgi:hypothetical protein